MDHLLWSLIAFVGSHFIMSHPLRAPMVKALGGTMFQIVYSLVSLATFAWVIFAFRAAPVEASLWGAGDGLWWVATVLMLLGSILFAGSLVGNPALPAPGAAALATKEPRGVFAITRHPMMWGFAIWALVHALVSPHPKVLLLSGFMALLALGGSLGQDRKKAVLMPDWSGWKARTSFLPFMGQLTGKSSWKAAWPGRTVLLIGTALWLVASWAHPWFGAPLAGLWRWL
jgi:uncharacterized membrane protein